LIGNDDDHAFDDDNVFDSDDALSTAALNADVVTAGAAADSAGDADERLSGLPRILRYLLLVNDRTASIELRRTSRGPASMPERCKSIGRQRHHRRTGSSQPRSIGPWDQRDRPSTRRRNSSPEFRRGGARCTTCSVLERRGHGLVASR
jgi:hypothetical protein